MTEQQRLANALAALGSTPEEVYEHLLAEGCYGDSGYRNCPIVDRLEQLGFIEPWVGQWGTWTGLARVENPAAVIRFIQRHDRGQFPALLRPPVAPNLTEK